jgi:hypothetical protein
MTLVKFSPSYKREIHPTSAADKGRIALFPEALALLETGAQVPKRQRLTLTQETGPKCYLPDYV